MTLKIFISSSSELEPSLVYGFQHHSEVDSSTPG